MKTLYPSRLELITTLGARRASLRLTFSRRKQVANLIVALLFAASSFIGISRAMAQVTSATPNGGFISFTVAAGASTAPVPLPLNIPWHVMGVVTTSGNDGVGEAEILMSNQFGTPVTEYVGLNSPNLGTTSYNSGSVAGNLIVAIDFSGEVFIETSSTKNSFVVTNTSSTTQTGYVTWMGFGTAINEPLNTSLGDNALSNNTTGSDNTASGYSALNDNMSGDNKNPRPGTKRCIPT
jgi:hypothetical protein